MGINVFTASGRCGQAMEVKYTSGGKAIGQFSLPVETGYGDSKKTSWVTCKMFGERAEKLAQYITKGAAVTVTGAFQLDEWEKDGVMHSRPCILVNDIQLPPQQQGGQHGQQHQQATQGQQQQPQQPQRQQAPQNNGYQQARNQAPQQSAPPQGSDSWWDEDIPL